MNKPIFEYFDFNKLNFHNKVNLYKFENEDESLTI